MRHQAVISVLLILQTGYMFAVAAQNTSSTSPPEATTPPGTLVTEITSIATEETVTYLPCNDTIENCTSLDPMMPNTTEGMPASTVNGTNGTTASPSPSANHTDANTAATTMATTVVATPETGPNSTTNGSIEQTTMQPNMTSTPMASQSPGSGDNSTQAPPATEPATHAGTDQTVTNGTDNGMLTTGVPTSQPPMTKKATTQLPSTPSPSTAGNTPASKTTSSKAVGTTKDNGPDANPTHHGNSKAVVIGLVVTALVVILVIGVFVYIKQRRLRNSYGRLNEETEDSGWSAFSKNPIYRGDRDYQPL
ncbi:uncharacterized protein [Diadema antillarum]|uniref:uncharacterized protein isoform X2 n=1 Tax=Diadema antillarum TaxID=105358 RepID=UPI003A8B48EB